MCKSLAKLSLLFLILAACNKDDSTDPIVETTSAEITSSNKILAKAEILETGSYEILDYGFIWGYNSQYIYDNYTESLGTTPESDTFSAEINITSWSNYASSVYVRAYIKNTVGTVYGSAIEVEPRIPNVSSYFPDYGSIGDTVTILGENFSSIPSENTILFENYEAEVIEATSTMLKVIVPDELYYYWSYYVDLYIDVYGYNEYFGYFYLN